MSEEYIGYNKTFKIGLFLRFTIYTIVIIVMFLLTLVLDDILSNILIILTRIFVFLFIIPHLYYLYKQISILGEARTSKIIFSLDKQNEELNISSPYSENLVIANIYDVQKITLEISIIFDNMFGPLNLWYPYYKNFLILNFENNKDQKIPIYSSPVFAKEAGIWLSEKLNIEFANLSKYPLTRLV